MNKRDLFLVVVEGHIGTPYRWGGDDPTGLDCSGLVNMAAQVVGLLGPKEDRTAAGWFQHSTPVTVGDEQPGDLIFYRDAAGDVVHVEVVLGVVDGVLYAIGANGGGSHTVDLASAVAANAFVKVVAARPGYVTRRILP